MILPVRDSFKHAASVLFSAIKLFPKRPFRQTKYVYLGLTVKVHRHFTKENIYDKADPV